MIITDAGGSILNNPNFNCSAACSTSVSANAMNEFAAKLNVVKNCGNGTGCWYASSLKYLGGSTFVNDRDGGWAGVNAKAILSDGTMLLVNVYSNSCAFNGGTVGTPLYNSVCGAIYMDINGASGPNTYGRDYFEFWITQTGIYPKGAFGDGNTCDPTSSALATSLGCAVKVLSEGAMSY